MTSIERCVYGNGALRTHAAATRTLLKFCGDHNSSDPALEHIRACLAALEKGERSQAMVSYKLVWLGKDGFGDWCPPVAFPSENEEYVDVVFAALVERWSRLMQSL